MEFTKEQFNGKGLYLAIPMYDTKCNAYTMNSVIHLQKLCMELEIPFKHYFIMGVPLVQKARNYLVDDFLKQEDKFNYILFIDSDIEFNPIDVLSLLLMEKDVIGAPCPLKALDWNKIKESVLNNKDIDPNVIPYLGTRFVFNPVADDKEVKLFEPIKVREVGLGYTLMRRKVFQKLDEHYDLKYIPNYDGITKEGDKISAYFDCQIDKDSGQYLSEDEYFSKIWRGIGGECWLCPWMKANHYGIMCFNGDIPLIAKNRGGL